MYDVDYEIYKYINEQAKHYVQFDTLLKQKNITFNEAYQKTIQFKEQFNILLSMYSIKGQNLRDTCENLIELIVKQPDNLELQYIYFCVVSDFGLLNRIISKNWTEEQEIRSYFRQNEILQELIEFLKCQLHNREKLEDIKKYFKKVSWRKNIDSKEETDFIYNLTIKHTFLHSKSKGNEIYKDNLNALIININSDEKLKLVKPYLIFAVLSRKTGMMQKRENFIPNLKAMFQYQDYNIYNDNGKNFNQYQSNLELYDHLRRSYLEDADSDISLCDYCFANLSPLSEWYYSNCEPNEDIPMNLRRKIISIMPKSFPAIIDSTDYEKLTNEELRKHLDMEED